MNIFTDKKLHPGFDKSIKGHYAGFYDTVYVALMPFFKIANTNRVYSYEDGTLPDEQTMLKSGSAISWEVVKTDVGFENIGDMQKALKTFIGSYKKVFERDDLVKKLSEYIIPNQIFISEEGTFDVWSKIKILNAFKLLNKTLIVIEDEYYSKKIELDITEITNEKFIETIKFKDYYIYDINKEILFSIGWDDFFFLICSSSDNVEKITSNLNFEGFYCTDTTEAHWEFTPEEIKKILGFAQ
ncbi:MAG: DUF2711 family protein [Saprospiraceae bacterium]|nr:DUF2711 family protein [Saprospiraceae bacterium]